MSNKSDTWNHFVKKGSSGICKYCHIEVKSCGNTTNLRNHLLRKHPCIKTASQRKQVVANNDIGGCKKQTEINDNINTPSTSKEKFGVDDVLSIVSSKDYCDFDISDLERVASSSLSAAQEKSKLNQLTMDSCVTNIKAYGVSGNKCGQLNNAIMLMISRIHYH